MVFRLRLSMFICKNQLCPTVSGTGIGCGLTVCVGCTAMFSGSGGDGRHQILCITHLPQIAAFADRHMRIAKTVAGKGDAKQTRTTVTRLQGAERIEELAEMLAGKDVTVTTRKQVEEMLATAG